MDYDNISIIGFHEHCFLYDVLIATYPRNKNYGHVELKKIEMHKALRSAVTKLS